MRMRTHRIATTSVGSLPVLVAALLAASSAQAQQIDTNPPLPNVLLLIDNSGSMERMIDGLTPETDPNASTASHTNQCNCVDHGPGTDPTCTWTGTLPSPNRWGIVQEAFSGSPSGGYSCVAMPRTPVPATFGTEYQINNIQPYDVNYYLPFHRMVAQDPHAPGATLLNPAACVYAPGQLDGASTGQGVGPNRLAVSPADQATDFSGSCTNGICNGSIMTRKYAQLAAPVPCTFAQNTDGAITQMKDLMRFGMMTFDQDPDPGIGVAVGPPMVVGNAPFQGMWSYFPGWNTGATCPYTGNPITCNSPLTMAVGARNPGAPAWEGRMVTFPSQNDIVTQENNNAEIESVIMATRPYGATPMAGMFADAQYYLYTDPKGPQQTDAFVQGSCRSEYVILLTDGAPNLDLQPACSAAGPPPAGKCPFLTPQATAAAMYNNGTSIGGHASVQTFVIGFAVSTITDGANTAQCSQFAKGGSLANLCTGTSGQGCNDPNLSAYVDPTYGNIGPCCELQCIAQMGGPAPSAACPTCGSAYFADTQGDLQNALGAILGSIASHATTRTTPSSSSAVTNTVANQSSPTTAAATYLASFSPAVGKPWAGDVQRQQSQCAFQGGSGSYTVQQSINPANGDDFASNLNSHTGPSRTFIGFQPAVVAGGSTVDASATIRPYAATNVADNLGNYSVTTYAGAVTARTASITPAALNSPAGPHACAYVSNVLGGGQKWLSDLQCTTMLLDFTLGQSTFGAGPSDFTFVSRYNSALGDIFHANPVAVGPPGTLLQDPTYVAFRQTWGSATSPWSQSTNARKQVLYVATNDGLLHAFWADENKLENNEMWAMLPPAVMPSLLSSYPSSHEFLLDGTPIVKDVVWDRNSGTSGGSVWHTMLVAGYGPYAQGYYAVDVTNPDPTGIASGGKPADPGQNGPVFMWQLTKEPATNFPLFGTASATPAITTLFMDPGDGQGARDIGVAILPGGQSGGPTTSLGSGTSCARVAKVSDSAPSVGYQTRGAVRCWGSSTPPKWQDPVPGRSVTIVRLDTGEVLRTFVRLADMATSYPSDTLLAAHRVTDAALDSPMTGTPLVFPGDVGTDATKFFVGDSDGTLWKFDVSSSDPTKWTGELFADLYNTTTDPTTSTSWGDGQPFQVTPVLSLDPQGRLVINAATGSIQTFDNTGVEYVYSITEMVQGNPAKLRANINWWLGPATMSSVGVGMQPGERVSGPMAVFNGTLYFSTYAAPAPNVASCNGGNAYLYGRDYVTPDVASDLSQGGRRVMQPPPPAAPQTPPPFSVAASSLVPTPPAGAIIPGVAIQGSPACAGLGGSSSDQYVAGQNHQMPQNFAGGTFSLFAQVGSKGIPGSNAATGQVNLNVPTPIAPTAIDSWAAVLE